MTGLPRVGCWYAVTPGGGDGEWFPPTLAGLVAAIAQAARVSATGPAQKVTKTSGRATTTIRTYQYGKQV